MKISERHIQLGESLCIMTAPYSPSKPDEVTAASTVAAVAVPNKNVAAGCSQSDEVQQGAVRVWCSQSKKISTTVYGVFWCSCMYGVDVFGVA